ncbi:MAG: hypothetical protein NVS2B16_05980 [Chloroflexota bacterium]
MALIAVIENELETLALLCEILVTAGYSVVAFQHPDELLRGEARGGFDAVVMSLAFGAADDQFFAPLMRDHLSSNAPMIAISNSTFLRRAAARSGLFDCTLASPLDAPALVESLARALRERTQDAS